MSLRLRLLLATGAASLLALVAMDIVTYTSLRGYLYGQIDQQLELAHPPIESALNSGAQLNTGLIAESAPGTFAEVRSASGKVLGPRVYAFSGATGTFLPPPDVPTTIAGLSEASHASTAPGSSNAPGSATAPAYTGGGSPPGGAGPTGGEPAVYLTT